VLCGVKRVGVGHLASFIMRSNAKPLLASICLTGLKLTVFLKEDKNFLNYYIKIILKNYVLIQISIPFLLVFNQIFEDKLKYLNFI
jgi:hypothetical protein